MRSGRYEQVNDVHSNYAIGRTLFIDEVKVGVLRVKESDAVICKKYHNGHKIRSMVFYPRNKLGIPKRHHAMMKDVRNSNMSDSDTMRYAKIEAIFHF